MENDNINFETQAVRTQIPVTQQREHSTPLYLTSSFVFEDPDEMRAAFAEEIDRNIYSRFSNPNVSEFVEKVCQMEGGEAGFAMATGMASVFGTFAGLLSSGDHVLSCSSVFGSTHTLFTKVLPKWGIESSYGDIKDPSLWESLIKPNTKLIYVETPSNPGIDIIDLEWLGKLAKAHNVILVVDNCFATPYLQRPIEFGADLVLHSATKFMDGQGRVLGGVVVGKQELIEEVKFFCRHSGPALSPFNSWVLSKSLETLAVRMDRHCENTLATAKFLEQHEMVEWVKYPFLPSHPQYDIAKKQMTQGGGVLAFGIKGGLDAGRKFLSNVKMASLTANLGDSRTIVTHPASTTHSKLNEEEQRAVGITSGLIRVSVGLEHFEDVIKDLDMAMKLACK